MVMQDTTYVMQNTTPTRPRRQQLALGRDMGGQVEGPIAGPSNPAGVTSFASIAEVPVYS